MLRYSKYTDKSIYLRRKYGDIILVLFNIHFYFVRLPPSWPRLKQAVRTYGAH